MKSIYSLFFTCFVLQQISVAQDVNAQVLTKKANSIMGFVENKGQIADHKGQPLPNVLFQSTGTGPQIFVTTSGLTYVFHQYNSVAANQEEKSFSANWSKVEMELQNASIQKENIVVENALPGFSNFYYAHCPQGILDVKSYHKVTIKNVYPGIDWVLNADNTTGLSHDFIVHPGANPSLIKIAYHGMNKNISLSKDGLLTISSAYGKIMEGGLKVFEEQSKKNIAANFTIHKNQLSFSLVSYDKNDALIIDPPLQWSMPQASSDFDYGYAITAAHDGSGGAILTGESDGTDFPVLNAYQGLLYGFQDMVVVRLDASGARLWSTYYGGTDYEAGKGVASDNAGNCYVIGVTGSSDMPVMNSLQANFGGSVYDAMIAKFSSTGVRQWASWRGGIGNDFGTAITCDGAGNVYATGYTSSTNFPVLNGVQNAKDVSYDAFIMKLNTSQVVQWSTFYGGNDEDKGRGITLDAAGANVYVTGSTLSGNFPGTTGFFQPSHGSANFAEDAFIIKLDAAESLLFASFCGGNDADFGQGIAVDNLGNIFVAGYTLSSNFPITNPGNGAYVDSTQQAIGTQDAFVMECNSAGTSRTWSTYFGGMAPDYGFAIAFDQYFGIYVCGNTASTDFPVQQPSDLNYYQSTQGDGGNYNDMFIALFDANDSIRWSTYYGDANGNEAYGICVDANDNIFVTGVDNNNIGVVKFNPGLPTGETSFLLNDGSDISLFPNPTSGMLNLTFDIKNDGPVEFEIFNAAGQCVMREERNFTDGGGHARTFQIGVESLADGIYFLEISSENGKEVKKFVKQ